MDAFLPWITHTISSLQATAEEHARALLEKEAVIEQLQHALSSRDKDIKVRTS